MSALISLLTSIPEKIDLIRKGRRDGPSEEIERIHSIMPAKRIELMSPELERYKEKYPYVYMICAQSLAIKFVLKKTHDTFFHAQSSCWLPFIYLTKELFKKRYPKLDCSHFKPLRTPRPSNPEILKRYQSGEALAPESEEHPGDHDPEVRKDLISVSPIIKPSGLNESALDFLTMNLSMLQEDEAVENACDEALSYFYPFLPPLVIQETLQKIRAVFKKAQDELSLCGSFFVICTPKNQRDQEIFYRSHPYGYACKCAQKANESELMDQFQQGFHLPLNCSETAVQYRIYTPHLQPDGGQKRVYHFTALSKPTRRFLKEGIRGALSSTDPLDRIIPRTPSEIPLVISLLKSLKIKSWETYQNEESLCASSVRHILSFLTR